MKEIFLIAPGPSASLEIAESIRPLEIPVGVVTSAYDLAPWAGYIFAADREWWRKNPQALQSTAAKYCSVKFEGTEKVKVGAGVNSGVLALEGCKNLGAEIIYLFGFDMRGTHYFGPYTNGLKNTKDQRRKIHLQQYKNWQRANKSIKVFNCTPSSALPCFEFKNYEF